MSKFLTNFTQLETQNKEFNMCTSYSGVSRDTAQGVEACVRVLRGEAQASARVDVPAALPTFFAVRTNESNTCVPVFHEKAWIFDGQPTVITRKLGYAHDRQTTVILEESFFWRRKKKERERGQQMRNAQICNCRYFGGPVVLLT